MSFISTLVPDRIKALLLRQKMTTLAMLSAVLRQPFGRQLRPPQQKAAIESRNKKINQFLLFYCGFSYCGVIKTDEYGYCGAAMEERRNRIGYWGSIAALLYCGATAVDERALQLERFYTVPSCANLFRLFFLNCFFG